MGSLKLSLCRSLAGPLLSSLKANVSKMVVFVGRADSFCTPSDSLMSSAAHCHSLKQCYQN